MKKPETASQKRNLRSERWFNDPTNPGMTALYLERYLNYGLTREELQSGKPIIGIAQTGNDLSPCNRHHLELAHRVREGISRRRRHRDGIPDSSDPGNRQAADRGAGSQSGVSRPGRNPVRLSARRRGADHRLRQDDARLPDGGRDRQSSRDRAVRRTDAERLVQWRAHRLRHGGVEVARRLYAAGEIDYEEFMQIVASSAPSVGHCNTMGTASTMNSLAEALGMSLPGCAAIPAPYRERGQIAYETGKRIVGMVCGRPEAVGHHDPQGVRERHRGQLGDRRVDQRADPSQRARPPHRRRASRSRTGRCSVTTCRCWSTCSPPASTSARRSTRAGGVPTVVRELMQHKRIHEDAITVNGRTVGDNCRDAVKVDGDVIWSYDKPLVKDAGFLVLHGNLFDSAHHEDQRHLRGIPRSAILSDPKARTRSRAAPSCSRG